MLEISVRGSGFRWYINLRVLSDFSLPIIYASGATAFRGVLEC